MSAKENITTTEKIGKLEKKMNQGFLGVVECMINHIPESKNPPDKVSVLKHFGFSQYYQGNKIPFRSGASLTIGVRRHIIYSGTIGKVKYLNVTAPDLTKMTILWGKRKIPCNYSFSADEELPFKIKYKKNW